MSKSVALVCAILLLLPGGCFLFFGVGLMEYDGIGPLCLIIAAAILAFAMGMLGVALRRRPGLAAERAMRELELRKYVVKRFVFGSRHDVRLPSGMTRDFPDESAFLDWAQAELKDNGDGSMPAAAGGPPQTPRDPGP